MCVDKQYKYGFDDYFRELKVALEAVSKSIGYCVIIDPKLRSGADNYACIKMEDYFEDLLSPTETEVLLFRLQFNYIKIGSYDRHWSFSYHEVGEYNE